jgi:hypothetical protein
VVDDIGRAADVTLLLVDPDGNPDDEDDTSRERFLFRLVATGGSDDFNVILGVADGRNGGGNGNDNGTTNELLLLPLLALVLVCACGSDDDDDDEDDVGAGAGALAPLRDLEGIGSIGNGGGRLDDNDDDEDEELEVGAIV